MGFAAGVGYVNLDLLYLGVGHLPKEGEEVYAKSLDIQLGGGVPATMITLSRLGVASKIATFLGEDVFSGYAKKLLDACGVSYANLYSGNGIPVAVTSVMITERDRTFMSALDRVDITQKIQEETYRQLRGAKVIDMHAGFLDAYKRLKEEGAILVFDVGWDEGLSIQKYREYLELADFFTPNQKEALKITGKDNVEEAARELGRFFPEVIIKLDSAGCLYWKNGESIIIPPLKNVNKIDSTGAGDAFMAGVFFWVFY
ncbi:carbohydrate kinase family protein [uncultured Robinsoniella sp.]|uniref:carbohydrate kinase family protein n=1 Tax=uncultured Robinsoniella sp. TaxID=904190 RepID=UPI00374F625E